jgi:hypothetical protein
MTVIWVLVFLAILIGCGYLSLRFFSRLSDVEMVAAMCWGFKAKRFELVLTWCMVYLIAFVFVFALLQKPFLPWTMNFSHEGGLLGYAVNDEHAKFYDPEQKEYVDYKISSPLPTAGRFDETFDVVAIYRPFLSGYYQNIELQGLWVSLLFIFVAALGLGLMYLTMYGLAGEYIAKTHLVQELSHKLILGRFKELTGVPFSQALIGVSLFIVLSTWIGTSMVNRITRDYAERFSEAQKDLKKEVMANVKPGKILQGRLINRIEDFEKIYGDRDHIHTQKRDDRAIHKTVYTIEFVRLTRYTPVYLRVAYLGEADDSRDMQTLDQFFPPRTSWSVSDIVAHKYAVEAQGADDLAFKVNDNYSVSLAEEQEGGEGDREQRVSLGPGL